MIPALSLFGWLVVLVVSFVSLSDDPLRLVVVLLRPLPPLDGLFIEAFERLVPVLTHYGPWDPGDIRGVAEQRRDFDSRKDSRSAVRYKTGHYPVST
jgi:hypothetical protein